MRFFDEKILDIQNVEADGSNQGALQESFSVTQRDIENFPGRAVHGRAVEGAEACMNLLCNRFVRWLDGDVQCVGHAVSG
jgi:hypothetical protein